MNAKLYQLVAQGLTLISADDCEEWVDEASAALIEADELGEWVPWKTGDALPMPQFHTSWLCTVRRRGTVDPTWLEIRRGGEWMFDDGTSTEVIAYRPDPLPRPYELEPVWQPQRCRCGGSIRRQLMGALICGSCGRTP